MRKAIVATMIAAIGLLGAGVASAEVLEKDIPGTVGGGLESGRPGCGYEWSCKDPRPNQSGQDRVGNRAG